MPTTAVVDGASTNSVMCLQPYKAMPTAVQDTYEILVRDRKAIPGLISYSRMGALYATVNCTLSITTPRVSYFLVNRSLPFSLLVFLVRNYYSSIKSVSTVPLFFLFVCEDE